MWRVQVRRSWCDSSLMPGMSANRLLTRVAVNCLGGDCASRKQQSGDSGCEVGNDGKWDRVTDNEKRCRRSPLLISCSIPSPPFSGSGVARCCHNSTFSGGLLPRVAEDCACTVPLQPLYLLKHFTPTYPFAYPVSAKTTSLQHAPQIGPTSGHKNNLSIPKNNLSIPNVKILPYQPIFTTRNSVENHCQQK